MPGAEMCGRFALKLSPATLKALFVLDQAPDYSPRYNIAPSTPIVAIRMVDGQRRADLLRWGLIPHWAKDEKIGYSTINARAETVAVKPAFREAFRRRRCLIPADGFYEWQAQPGTKAKQPYLISRADGAPLAFAGLWERWHPPQGLLVESCSIIVTAANALVQPIHDRMPVLLDPGDFKTWLDPDNHDPHALTGLLRAYPAERMQAVPVGMRVNNPRNDDAELIEEIRSPASR
jgi:putative SOS response-associated peptidase YedK